jgi:hypothetical protein
MVFLPLQQPFECLRHRMENFLDFLAIIEGQPVSPVVASIDKDVRGGCRHFHDRRSIAAGRTTVAAAVLRRLRFQRALKQALLLKQTSAAGGGLNDRRFRQRQELQPQVLRSQQNLVQTSYPPMFCQIDIMSLAQDSGIVTYPMHDGHVFTSQVFRGPVSNRA